MCIINVAVLPVVSRVMLMIDVHCSVMIMVFVIHVFHC